jgi:hypothetical protein
LLKKAADWCGGLYGAQLQRHWQGRGKVNFELVLRLGGDIMDRGPALEAETMQKLVTVYLDNHAYMGGKLLRGSYADKHGLVEEHLRDYLADGWAVKQIHSFGGADDGLNVRGWIVVVLEK